VWHWWHRFWCLVWSPSRCLRYEGIFLLCGYAAGNEVRLFHQFCRVRISVHFDERVYVAFWAAVMAHSDSSSQGVFIEIQFNEVVLFAFVDGIPTPCAFVWFLCRFEFITVYLAEVIFIVIIFVSSVHKIWIISSYQKNLNKV
jgi:hypothetical protein